MSGCSRSEHSIHTWVRALHSFACSSISVVWDIHIHIEMTEYRDTSSTWEVAHMYPDDVEGKSTLVAHGENTPQQPQLAIVRFTQSKLVSRKIPEEMTIFQISGQSARYRRNMHQRSASNFTKFSPPPKRLTLMISLCLARL